MLIQQLKDKDIFPSDKVIEKVLGVSFSVYKELKDILNNHGITPEWRYYNDGKAWLCKMTHKKKTVLWLSVWNECFKVSFYFTEKYTSGINELVIDKSVKNEFFNNKSVGKKLFPLKFTVNEKEQIKDVVSVIKYKMSTL